MLRIETSQLSELFLVSAIELDNYILGRETRLGHVNEISKFIKEYQFKNQEDFYSKSTMTYINLWKAMRRNSSKELRYLPEFALEMKLLSYELEDAKRLPRNRLETLRDFCIYASNEFERELWKFRERRYVA